MSINIYRDKIIKLLEKNHLLSISDIHKKISGVDYSTVYRNIEQLVVDEEIKKVVFDKGRIMYEVNNTQNNHDHFVCNSCGAVDELERPVFNLRLLKNHAVTDVLVRGFCRNCN
ncbi:MAG: transcriptional repressor [Candidatus Paceibacterota bacterium]